MVSFKICGDNVDNYVDMLITPVDGKMSKPEVWISGFHIFTGWKSRK